MDEIKSRHTLFIFVIKNNKWFPSFFVQYNFVESKLSELLI